MDGGELLEHHQLPLPERFYDCQEAEKADAARKTCPCAFVYHSRSVEMAFLYMFVDLWMHAMDKRFLAVTDLDSKLRTTVRSDKSYCVTHSCSTQTATMARKSRVFFESCFQAHCYDACFGGEGAGDAGQLGSKA
jgi:hypothetical protein